MKMHSRSVALSALLACAAVHADPVVEHKSWQQSYPVTSATPRLVVRNIWGNVTVRPGAAGEIVVSAVETRSARTAADFEKSREQLRLEVVASADGVSLSSVSPAERIGWMYARAAVSRTSSISVSHRTRSSMCVRSPMAAWMSPEYAGR